MSSIFWSNIFTIYSTIDLSNNLTRYWLKHIFNMQTLWNIISLRKACRNNLSKTRHYQSCDRAHSKGIRPCSIIGSCGTGAHQRTRLPRDLSNPINMYSDKRIYLSSRHPRHHTLHPPPSSSSSARIQPTSSRRSAAQVYPHPTARNCAFNTFTRADTRMIPRARAHICAADFIPVYTPHSRSRPCAYVYTLATSTCCYCATALSLYSNAYIHTRGAC